MDRIKAFINGDASTPPSLNPNHSAKDDLRHAAKDLVHAKDDLTLQAKEKAHDLGRSVRGTANNIENRAADATADLRASARHLGNEVRHDARQLGNEVRHDARQGWGAAQDAARDVRADARDVRKDVREDLRDARDTGRRVSRDIDAKVRATGREISADADELARRARRQAHNAKVELEDDFNQAASTVGNGLRDAKDTVVGGIVLLEDKIESGFDRLGAKAHHAADRIRAEANSVARDVRNAEKAVGDKVAQVTDDVEKRLSYITFANKQAPWFRDVGYGYDVTFNQFPIVGKRVAITTPNLLGRSVPGAALSVSSVHNSTAAASSEQLTSNFSWTGDFFTRRPIVRVQNGASTWEFRRPQRVDLEAYGSLPVNGGLPTLKAETTVTDLISRSVFGGSLKLTGKQFKALYRTRLPYVALSGAAVSDATGEKVYVSTGIASTVFSDRLRESQVSVGIEAQSTQFNLKQSSTPDALGSVTAKIEYDEPSFSVDARVRASSFGQQSNELKVSDAKLRGLYIFNQGQFPRTAVGVTVGVSAIGAPALDEDDVAAADFLPYGEPNQRVPSNFFAGLRGKAFAQGLDAPVAGVNVTHAITPQSRVAFGITSLRSVAASFIYRLRPDISVQTSVTTELPSWSVPNVAQAGAFGKPQLGISVAIGAI